MPDFIAHNHPDVVAEWVFLVCLSLLISLAFLRVYFGKGLRLISQAAFTQRHTNQFLRDTNTANVSLFLLPVFVIVFALFLAHPKWSGGQAWEIKPFFNYVLAVSSYFLIKYIVIKWLGHLFQQVYLFEEVMFQSFLFEKVAGLLLFPFLTLAVYAPWNEKIFLDISIAVLLLLLALKWGRMLYIAFFKRPISKMHLFMYLCALEILPLIVLIKLFLL